MGLFFFVTFPMKVTKPNPRKAESFLIFVLNHEGSAFLAIKSC